MELIMVVGSIIFLVMMIKSANKIENYTAYKTASPEEQKAMLENAAKKKPEHKAKTTSKYDYKDTKSAITHSSSTNSSVTYNNPSTGLPMTNGIGGVDSSGTPYGM